MNLDLIPNAEVLKNITIDAERAKRQEIGIKVISAQLCRTSESGRHEMTLNGDYMIKTYSLDILMLKTVFEEKGYKVTVIKDGYGYTDSIVIKW